MIIYLALIICILSLLQKGDERFFPAVAYAIVNIGHYLLFDWWADGYTYYISAAVADVIIMAWIMSISRISNTAISLMRVCIAEVVVNFGGWALWWHHHEPSAYNAVFIGLHLWVILILLGKDKSDERGGFEVDRWTDYLRLLAGAGNPNLQSRSSETCK